MVSRIFSLVLCSSLAVPFTAANAAEDFPDHSISIRVAYSAGGSTDRQIRVLSELVSKELGQPVVVENWPGAAGTRAASSLTAGVKPDGYTLAHAPVTVFRLPHMQSTNWDPMEDFTYVTGLSGYILGIGVHVDSPFQTWEDLANYAKEHPGEVTYSSVGIGSTQHLGMTEIEEQTGLSFNHIPYKGGAETAQALLTKEVMFSPDPLSTFGILGDDVRLLMLWEPERHPSLPDVPTAQELGIDLVMQSPYGLIGPKGMDPEVVQKISDAFGAVMEDPKHLEVLDSIKQTIWHLSPEEYQEYAQEAYASEGELIDRIGLKTD